MPALKLAPARRAELRSAAHPLNPVVLIGADGLTDAVVAEIDRNLDAHQLIKIRVFGDDRDVRVALYDDICARLNAAPIQHIGKLLVIWRPAPAEPRAAAPGLPTAAAAARAAAAAAKAPKGAAPRLVRVVKPSGNPSRRAKPTTVLVRGNERVTAGGNVKKAKKRQTSVKRQQQNDK